MSTMPRPRLPNLVKEIARERVFWYFRKGKGQRVRIRGDYGSPEFLENYEAARNGGARPQKKPAAQNGTLAWLIERYKDSSAWERLSTATKSQRDNIYKIVIGRAGDMPLSQMTQATIQQGVEDRAKTPFAANDFLKAMRALFKWADKSQIANNVTNDVQGFPHKTEGFHTWSEEEIAQFESRWPIGTRERLALAVLLYTGLRRGDAARLGRQHVRDGTIKIRTEKTGTQVEIPILPELAAIIDATKTGDMAFIATPSGGPMVKESFGTWFRLACRAAGVPGRAHGLRKAGATRAANNGATERQLNAIFGWADGSRQSATYTRNADHARLAREAMEKLAK